MRFGTMDGKQLVIEWFMREWPLGDVLKGMGCLKMGGRNAEFASELMSTVWYCVAVARPIGCGAPRKDRWKRQHNRSDRSKQVGRRSIKLQLSIGPESAPALSTGSDARQGWC